MSRMQVWLRRQMAALFEAGGWCSGTLLCVMGPAGFWQVTYYYESYIERIMTVEADAFSAMMSGMHSSVFC